MSNDKPQGHPPPDAARDEPRKRILRLRAARASGSAERIRDALVAEILDGEFFLEKGRYLFETGQHAAAIAVLERCQTAEAAFAPQDEIRRRALVYRAHALTRLYEENKIGEARERTLNGWFDVKFAFRANQASPDFAAANDHIRRLTNDVSNATADMP